MKMTPMLLTVTPNPCIERILKAPRFTVGAVHRIEPQNLYIQAGGKGINAARVATRFGVEAKALLPAGKLQHTWFEHQLAQEGVPCALIEVAADTRVSVNVLHERTSAGEGKTELVEAGAPLSVADGTRLIEKFMELLPHADLVALCGSYPPTGEPAFQMHATLLCQLAQRAGKRVIYDGKGPSFEMAVRSKTPPWLIKPNTDEAAALLHRTLDTPADERRAVHDLLHLGMEVVILSCGARGAYLGHTGGIEWLAAPKIEEVSPVGSGDSLVGAFAAHYLKTGDLLESTCWGVAAGSANAAQERSGFCTPEDAAALLPQVRRSVREIPLSSK